MVDLRAHPLPGQLRATQARLRTQTKHAQPTFACAREKVKNPIWKMPIKKPTHPWFLNYCLQERLLYMSQFTDMCCTWAIKYYHINLSIGVPHIADNAAVFHSVELLPGDNILVAYSKKKSYRWELQVGTIMWRNIFPFIKMEQMGLNSIHSTSAGDHHVHQSDDFAQLDHSEAVHAARTHTDIYI